MTAFGAGVLLATAVSVALFLLGPVPPKTPDLTSSSPTNEAPTEVIAALLVDGVGAEFAPGWAPEGVRVGPGEYELLNGLPESDPKAPLVWAKGNNWKAGEWHHVALTFHNLDTGKAEAATALYLDGKLFGEVKDQSIGMGWDVEKAGVYLPSATSACWTSSPCATGR